MAITAAQISNVYRQCKSPSDLGEGLRWGFVKKGDHFIDACSWEGRVRRFVLGKSCYPTAKEAIDYVSSALQQVEIQDEETARALIELRERIKPPHQAKAYRLPPNLEKFEERKKVDPFADSELFAENSDGPIPIDEALDISLAGWMARLERAGRATSNRERLSQLEEMQKRDSELREELASCSAEERSEKIKEAAQSLCTQALSTEEPWMLKGSAGRAGFSLHLLLEGLKKTGIKELLLRQTVDDPELQKLLASDDPLGALTRLFKEHLETFEKEMPKLSEKEERILATVADLLVEKESRSIDLKVPRFIGHEINALYKNGLLGSLMAFLSPELQSVVEITEKGLTPFSTFDPDNPASKKAIEVTTALISSLLGYSGKKGDRFLQRHFESLFESLPNGMLERTGCEELITRSPIYYTFQRCEGGTYTISVHALGAAFQNHHGGGFPIKITAVREEKLTDAFFERLLTHHFAPEFDAELISDPSQLYRLLLEELEGKVERIQASPSQNRSKLSEMLLCNNPGEFDKIEKDARYCDWRGAVEPYLNREAKSLSEMPQPAVEKLRKEAASLLKACANNPVQKSTLEQFLALSTSLRGEAYKSRVTKLMQKLSLSKEGLREYRETLLWLFGEEFDESIQFIESLIPESVPIETAAEPEAPAPVKKADRKKRAQRSRIIQFLSSSAFHLIIRLIRINLQLASLIKNINYSLISQGCSLLETRLLGTFLKEILPLGLVEWINELVMEITKWALTLMLRILVTRIMPGDLRRQLESSFDEYRAFLHALLSKVQGKETLSYKVDGFLLPPQPLEQKREEASPPANSASSSAVKNRIKTPLNYQPLEALSEAEIFTYLEESLSCLKQSPPSRAMEMEPLFKALGIPHHGEASIGDRLQDKEKFIDLLVEIGKEIPQLERDPCAILYYHQLMAHVDRIVTEEERGFVLAYNSSLRGKRRLIAPHETKLSLMRAPQLLKYFAGVQIALKTGLEQRLYRELMEYFYPEAALATLHSDKGAYDALLHFSPLESYVGNIYSDNDSVSSRIADYMLGFDKSIELSDSSFRKIISSYHPEDESHPFFTLLEERFGKPDQLHLPASEDLFRFHTEPTAVPKLFNRLARMQTHAMSWQPSYASKESETEAIESHLERREMKSGWNISEGFLFLASLGSHREVLELIHPSNGYVTEMYSNVVSGLDEKRPSDAAIYEKRGDANHPWLTDAELLLINHPQDAPLRALEILRKTPAEILNRSFIRTLEVLFLTPGLMNESIHATGELGNALEEWAVSMVRHFKENREKHSLQPLLSLLIFYKNFVEAEHEESCAGLFLALLPEIEAIDYVSEIERRDLTRTLVALLTLNPREDDKDAILSFYKRARPLIYEWNLAEPNLYRVCSYWDKMLPEDLETEETAAPFECEEELPIKEAKEPKLPRTGKIPLSSIAVHGLSYLTRLTSDSDIVVGVEEGKSSLTSLSLFRGTVNFDIVDGKAVGRDAFRGEEIAERQFHPALQGFSSYLLLTSPSGKMRALIPARALTGSLLHRLFVYLGPLEPCVQGFVESFVKEFENSQAVISLEITPTGELLASDGASIELLLTHRLLQGNYSEAVKLFTQFESLARRKPLGLSSEMLATVAALIPTKEIDARTLRLKLIALTYENSLLHKSDEAPKQLLEEKQPLLLLSLLSADLMLVQKDGIALSEREEWLLYEKLFDLGTKAIGTDWFSSLYTEILPGGMRSRYRELRSKFQMDSCWIERAGDAARFLIGLKVEEKPVLSRQQMVAALRSGLDKLLPSYKSFEMSDILRPLLLLTPIWDSPLFTNSDSLRDSLSETLLPGSPLDEKSFWPLYRLAFTDDKEQLREWVRGHSGIGTAKELALLELLKAALAHPYIMPSPESLLSEEFNSSFRGDLFVPFAIAHLSSSALGCLKNHLIRKGREWIIERIPELSIPNGGSRAADLLESIVTKGVDAFVKSNTMTAAEASFAPDETEHRKALLACDRKWGAPLEAMGRALFDIEEFPEEVIEEIPGSEGTRLQKSMKEHKTKKKLFRLKHPGDLYRVYFGLTMIEEELQGEILGREARLQNFLQNTAGEKLSLNQWQKGLLNGKSEKLLRKSGLDDEEILEVKHELEMLLLIQVERMRYRRALSAFRTLQTGGGEEAIAKILAGELNQPHLVQLEKWPDWLIQKSLLIERENNFLLWEKQVSIIEQLLKAEDQRIAIEAIPGIGKSAVLKQIIEEMRMRKGLGVFTVVPSPLIGECARYNSEQAERISGKGDATLNLFNPELYTNPQSMKLLFATVQSAIDSGEGINLTRQDLSYLEVRFIEALIKPGSMPAACRRYLRKLLDLVSEKVTLIVDEPQIVFYYRDLFITPLGGKRQLSRQLVEDTEEAIAALSSHPLIAAHISTNSLPTLSKESYEEALAEVADDLLGDGTLVIGTTALSEEVVQFLTDPAHEASAALQALPSFSRLSLYRGIFTDLFPRLLQQSVSVNFGIGKEGFARPFSGNMDCKEKSTSRQPLDTLLRTFVSYYNHGLTAEQKEETLKTLEILKEKKLLKEVKEASLDSKKLIGAYMRFIAAPRIPYFPETIEHTAADMVSMFAQNSYTAMTGTIYSEGSYPGEKKVLWSDETLGEAISILQNKCSGISVLEAETPEEILDETLETEFKDGSSTALIDGGAKLVGMNSRRVAERMRAFAKKHAPHIQGIRFFAKDSSGTNQLMFLGIDAKEAVLASQVNVLNSALWTYYSDLEGTGANVPQANLAGVVLVSEKIGSTGTTLASQIQYCFRMRGILNEGACLATQNQPSQSIRFVMTKSARQIIFGKSAPTLSDLLAFNYANEQVSVKEECYFARPQHMKAVIRGALMTKIRKAPSETEAEILAEKGSCLLTSTVEMDPAKLWGGSIKERDPKDVFSAYKDSLLHKAKACGCFSEEEIALFDRELSTLVLGKNLDLPKTVATSQSPDFSQNGEVRMEATTETETSTEQQQQQQQSLADAPQSRKHFAESDLIIRDPLTPPAAEALSSRLKEGLAPSYLRFSENFLPGKKTPGSKHQRPVKELLIHGELDKEGNFIPSSIVALSEKDAESWRNALYTIDPDEKKKAFLWDVSSQLVAAGSPLPRALLKQNSTIAEAAALFKFFSRETSYLESEKEALSLLFSTNFDSWYKLFDKIYLKRDSAILRSDLGVIFGAAMRLYRKRHPLIRRRSPRKPSQVTCG